MCHSFWVPRLAGKTDLIPGRTNQMWFQTDRAGLYLGQCAEYCGTQHANMLLARDRRLAAEFQSWLDQQKKPAVARCAAVREGRERVPGAVVRQLPPGARHDRPGHLCPGPDAPDEPADAGRGHGSQHARRTCANGSIDPQKIKPGCLMPAFGLSRPDSAI